MPVTQTREFFLLSSKWNESVIQSLQDRAIRYGKFPRYARGGVVVEWNSNGSERVRAIFPIYRFPICFKYSGSIDSLNRCYFILQHIPRFDPLSPSLFFSSFFLSRQIFVPLSDFIDYTSRCNVLNDCFPISTEFCYFNQLLTLRYYQSRDVSFYLYIYIKEGYKMYQVRQIRFFPFHFQNNNFYVYTKID